MNSTSTPSGVKTGGIKGKRKPTLPKRDWAANFKKVSDRAPSSTSAFGSDFEAPMTMDHVPHPAYWALPPGVGRHPDYDAFGADNIPDGVNRTFGGGEVEGIANADPLDEGYTSLVPNDGRSSNFGIGTVIPSTYKPPVVNYGDRNPAFGAFEGQHVPFGAEGSKDSKSWLVGVLGILGIWLGYEWMAKKIKREELLERLHGHHG